MNAEVLIVVQAPRNPKLFINVLPPVGALSIVSYLRSRGVRASVRDCNVQELSDEEIGRAEIIGLSVNVSNVENSLETARRVKSRWPGKRVVAGGPFCISAPERLLEEGTVDAVAVGEGEETLLEMAGGKEWPDIKGLWFKDGAGRAVFTGPRPWIEDLDGLPFPALDLVPLEKYYSPVKKTLPVSSLISSRGCPYNCIFCFKTMGNRWRARSPGNVVDEIEWQVRELGVREICIYDDNFTMDTERAAEISDEILRRGIDVSLQLTNGVRVDRLTRELVRKLKAAGVWIIGVAPESGSPETLERIGKRFSLEQVRRSVRWCKDEGIRTYSFFMVGFPWETRGHIEETIDFAVSLDTELTQFSRVVPFPGTRLHDIIPKASSPADPGLRDQGLFYGGVSHELEGLAGGELEGLIKKAYRRVYLRPGKMVRLISMLSWGDLWRLFSYSVTTDSI